MTEKTHLLFVGLAGEAAIAATNAVSVPDVDTILQVIIGLVTLWKLIKKPKPKN